jgi:hypothetical protein
VRLLERRGWTSAAVLAAYVLISFAYWGVRLLPHPGRYYLGTGTDPQIFIWSIGWWPHAIAHNVSAVHTHAIWAPEGQNLAWATSVPGVALAFAPLTWLAGPVISYNVAALLMPALAAWTAFLLCRHLTRSLWPSVVGGYLFGFSSYMVGQTEGHMHMTSVFLLPLIALVVIRYVQHEYDGLNLTIRLGPMLGLQFGLSTENAFSYALALATAIVLAFVLVPFARRRLVQLVAPLAASYAVGCVLAAPLLYYALTGFQSGSINEPTIYTTDLLNLILPTHLILVGGRAARTISEHFPANDSERDGYLGIPVLVMFVLFAIRRWRTPAGRLLLAGFAVALVASFGAWLTVYGHRITTMPWEHVSFRPLFNNVLPSRLMLFVAFVVAIAVALWMSSTRGWLAVVLPVLAVISLVPNPTADAFRTAAHVPQFFRGDGVRRCVAPNENVLIFPQAKHGSPMLWQAVSGYRFRLADGYMTPDPPTSFYTSPAAARIANREVTWRDLVPFARDKHVTALLVDAKQPEPWMSIVKPLYPPRDVGGVLVYRFDRKPRC